MYNPETYSRAFELLGTNPNHIPDSVRETMIFVALNIDFEANENKEAIQNLFGSTSGFLRNDPDVHNTLTAIRKLQDGFLSQPHVGEPENDGEPEIEMTELEEAEAGTQEAYGRLADLREENGLKEDDDIIDEGATLCTEDFLRLIAAAIDYNSARRHEEDVRKESEAKAAGA